VHRYADTGHTIGTVAVLIGHQAEPSTVATYRW